MSERPMPPEDWECCESGCSPCVWDTYYKDLKEWNAEQKALKNAESSNQSDQNNGDS